MRFLPYLIFFPLMISCFEQGDCSDLSSNVITVNFYDYSTRKGKTILLDSVKVDGLDTVMYKNKGVNKIALPLDYAQNNLIFHFYYEMQHAILVVNYEFKTFALAPDCNAIDLINLTKLNAEVIQEAKIIQPKITSTQSENIRLYF